MRQLHSIIGDLEDCRRFAEGITSLDIATKSRNGSLLEDAQWDAESIRRVLEKCIRDLKLIEKEKGSEEK